MFCMVKCANHPCNWSSFRCARIVCSSALVVFKLIVRISRRFNSACAVIICCILCQTCFPVYVDDQHTWWWCCFLQRVHHQVADRCLTWAGKLARLVHWYWEKQLPENNASVATAGADILPPERTLQRCSGTCCRWCVPAALVYCCHAWLHRKLSRRDHHPPLTFGDVCCDVWCTCIDIQYKLDVMICLPSSEAVNIVLIHANFAWQAPDECGGWFQTGSDS